VISVFRDPLFAPARGSKPGKANFSAVSGPLDQAVWESAAWEQRGRNGNERTRRGREIFGVGHLMDLW